MSKPDIPAWIPRRCPSHPDAGIYGGEFPRRERKLERPQRDASTPPQGWPLDPLDASREVWIAYYECECELQLTTDWRQAGQCHACGAPLRSADLRDSRDKCEACRRG